MEELYDTINKLDSVLPPNKKIRKQRTTKPKQPTPTAPTTAATKATPKATPKAAPKATPKATAKDTTIIKINTTDKTLKTSTDNFKTQKKKETANIKQQLKDHAALTKQVHILNKSIAKLAKHK